ncbi:sphingosine-1-phosphate phosphatase 2 isoform X2 [Alosa sapidissima]|uniref:sphingosine-1-phosphate phosphatase 2 isoform X2 n=1 Tax=Alosa sapidissima TaxID=34773 RepID=UPI001C09F6BA|nr:sphingosine-1-phosphate phosphatase 2 isoform X2 [Alosa sapidissima]
MRGLITHLHSSELVARFQRACGLYPATRAEDKSVHSHSVDGHPVPNGNASVHRHRAEAGTGKLNGGTREQDSNSNYKCSVSSGDAKEYVVRSRPLHFLFLVSAALGNEVFYISFLPCLHWNLDPFLCRRCANIWVVMYVGQVLKDVLKLPRPLAPPVVKLERRVDAEYGLPSTHAMAATAISFTLLLSAPQRVQFQWEVGLFLAVLLSVLVCLSRLYTGMHSALDVICGVLLTAVVMATSYPLWPWLDEVQLHSRFSPVLALVVPVLLCGAYPELDHYSTTRGDTTIIMGVASGCWLGYWLNQQRGRTFEPEGPLPVPLPSLTAASCVQGAARFALGLSVLLATRQSVRWTSLALVCRCYGESPSNPEARRRKEIEVVYKFVTYAAVGLVNTVLVNRLFLLLGLL